MTPAKKSTGKKAAVAKKTAVAKKAPAAKKSAPRRRAPASQAEGLHLRKGETWVAIDGANVRHVAEVDSDEWTVANRPICGARPVVGPFVETGAKLPVCDNCKTSW